MAMASVSTPWQGRKVRTAPARRRARRRLGDYVVIHDPEGTLSPWRSMFPEIEVLAGLRMRTWAPGTLFYHLRRGLTYQVSEMYTLELVEAV